MAHLFKKQTYEKNNLNSALRAAHALHVVGRRHRAHLPIGGRGGHPSDDGSQLRRLPPGHLNLRGGVSRPARGHDLRRAQLHARHRCPHPLCQRRPGRRVDARRHLRPGAHHGQRRQHVRRPDRPLFDEPACRPGAHRAHRDPARGLARDLRSERLFGRHQHHHQAHRRLCRRLPPPPDGRHVRPCVALAGR